MAVFNNILAGASGATGAAAGFKIDRSLRFNSADSAYLNRTPSSAGNRKTWTWSGWVKRSKLGTSQHIFEGSLGPNDVITFIRFESSDKIGIGTYDSGYQFQLITDQVFRDISGWYSLVLAVDTTQATASNRVKLWVNGSQVTQFSTSTYPTQNHSTWVNNNSYHFIGKWALGTQRSLDAYLAEVHFIDGQALAPTDFGEYDDNNVWQPKEYVGTYGPTLVNYYDNSQTDLPDGNVYLNTQPVENIFDGDDTTYARINRGTNNDTNATFRWEPTGGYSGVTKIRIKTDFTTQYNINGGTFQSHTAQGWTEIYNGSAITLNTLQIRRTNASGADYGIFVYGIEINDTLVANINNNGFHLDFSDNSSNAALGTDSSGNSNDWTVNNISVAGSAWNQSQTWSTYGSASSGGAASGLGLERGFNGAVVGQTEGDTTNAYFSIPFSTTIASGDVGFVSYASSGSGHMKLYNGSTEVDDVTSSGNSQFRYSTYVGAITEIRISRDGRAFEFAAVSVKGEILVDAGLNDPAIKDIDSLIDTPTNYEADSGNNGGNFCTLNPLDKASTQTLSNGNLQLNINQSLPTFATTKTTFGISSGKFYWEFVKEASSSFGTAISGIWPTDETSPTLTTDLPAGIGSYTDLLGFGVTGSNVQFRMKPSGNVQSGSYTEGQVFGIAFDADAGKFYAFINGSELSGQNISAGTSVFDTVTVGKTYVPFGYNGNGGSGTENVEMTFNFGQRAYAFPPGGTGGPPSDYKSLCTTNLPDPTIADGSTAFDTKLWTGNGSTQTISGLNHSPDFIWHKTRSIAGGHQLYDSVRGVSKRLRSDTTDAESTVNGVTAFNSDGWTMTGGNNNNETYVSWTWDAGSSNTSISAGGLNSSVYNTSDRWRDDVAGSTYGSQPKTRLFDGNIAQNLIADSGYSLTFSPSGFSSITSLRIYGASYTGNANGIVINGTDYTSLFPSGTTTPAWVTIPETSLTTIVWSTQSNGYENGSLNAIEVDGKILIDDDATPPNVPSIASTVRAAPSAGFSIVKVDNPTATESRAHGLNKKPDFIIGKALTGSQQWHIYHSALGKDYYGTFQTSAFASSDQWGSQEPNSNVFYVKANTGSGANFAGGMIYYIWTAVESYSAFGSYTGNGSADGPFIFTGHLPRFVMIKRTDSSGNDWQLYDTARSTFNEMDDKLKANSNGAEVVEHPIDFLSNGFKPRNTANGSNGSGATYIYASFASSPFKTARAR